MGTTQNQGSIQLIARLINRLFFRKQGKQDSQSHYKGTLYSFQKNEVNQSHSSYHGDEEAFWFI